jgi:hypothetical protein
MFSLGRIVDIKEFKDISLRKFLLVFFIFAFLLSILKLTSPVLFDELFFIVNKYSKLVRADIITLLIVFIKISSYLISMLFIILICTLILNYFYWDNNIVERLNFARNLFLLKIFDYYFTLSMWYILYLVISYIFEFYLYLPKYLSFILFLALFIQAAKIFDFIFTKTE